MPLKQKGRMLAIETPLGTDVVAARSVSVQEELGRLFQIEAELSSEDGEIDFDKVVGHNVTVRLEVGQKATRYFNGFVSRFVQVANEGGYAHYRATIVPWLWLLTRTSDCRIFQDKSIPEIIEAVFQAQGFSDYQIKLSGSYPTREFCVQYRETDFNFVSRLMEQEGIYYFFVHENGKHTLVLCDSISAHKPFEGYEEVTFQVLERGATGREAVTEWTAEKEVQPVACALKDFNFKKPRTPLLVSKDVTRQHGEARYEIYDYPGAYEDDTDGERLAQVRLEEAQTQHEVFRGQASARGLAAGCTFQLKGHPRGDREKEYLITSVSLQADAGEFATGAGGRQGAEFFSCTFTALDKAQQFRPARLTPKPLIQGPQTAMVVGPSSEEIHTDEHARVKVQFHWDRYGKGDENSSCWVRVSQVWAGKKWGAVFIPRIGNEVIVEFLEGDPDRPIITGRVYNEECKPPADLPAAKTASAFKSLSTKGGGFNEISFDDTKGEEKMFLHSQHNLDMRTGNDRCDTISNDYHVKVASNCLESVGANCSLTIGGQYKISTGSDLNLTVGGKSAASIAGSDSRKVGGAVIEKNGADRSMSVAGTLLVTAPTIILKGASHITLDGGGSHVVIEAGGIKISTGGDVEINGVNVKATANAAAKLMGATVDVNGSGPVSVMGAIVKVNA